MPKTLPAPGVRSLLTQPPLETEVRLQGWVRTKRESKAGVAFLEINDGSYFQSLQAVVPATLANYSDLMHGIHAGTAVSVVGKVVASQGGKQAVEIQASEVEILGPCDPAAYPLGK